MSASLRGAAVAFEPGKTEKAQVERELGVAFSYPVRGWHTYASTESGKACLLSAFYRQGVLIAVELYVPRTDRAPALEPRDFGGLRLEPGGVAIGMSCDDVGADFSPVAGGPGNVVYDRIFEAAFPGGVAYAMAVGGVIERLAIYAGAAPPPA